MTFRRLRCPYGRSEAAVVTKATLERARDGDDRAFGELTDPYLGELRLHCYRILGSVQDAEDMLQETLLAAWRGLGGYEGRVDRADPGGDRISAITRFVDNSNLARFGLPLMLAD